MIAMGEVETLPLAEAVYAAAIRAGAYPQVQFLSETLRHSLLKYGSAEQLAWVPEIEAYGMEWADVYIGLRGAYNLHMHSQIPAERLCAQPGRHGQGLDPALGEDALVRRACAQCCLCLPGRDGRRDRCRTCSLTPACSTGKSESRRWREWAQALDRAATVRVVGKETDLRFSVQGRTWIVGDGKFNMPDGEIHTAPITSTIDGQIYFEDPGVLGGRLMHDIRLRWEQGRLVEATASTNQDYLQSIVRTDAGASLIGEFAFGTNPHVDSFYQGHPDRREDRRHRAHRPGPFLPRKRRRQPLGHPLGHRQGHPPRRRGLCGRPGGAGREAASVYERGRPT